MAQGASRRRVRRIGWTASTAIVLVLATTGATAPAASPPSQCRAVRLLLDAGLLRAASDAYHRLQRRTDPRDPAELRRCVRDGFREISEVRRRRANAIDAYGRREGLSSATIERLTTAVRIAPTADDVTRIMAAGIARRSAPRLVPERRDDGGRADGGGLRFGPGEYGVAIAATLHRARYDADARAVLDATIARFPLVEIPADLRGIRHRGEHLRAAQALSRAGLDDAALEQLREALIEDPTIAIPPELSEADHRTDWWNDWRGRVGPSIRSFAELLLAGLIAAFALVALMRIGSRLWRKRVVIDDFTAREETFGKTASASVRESYIRLLRDDGGFRLKLVSPGAQDLGGLPAGVTDVVPRARFVDAVLTLLDRILPTRTWRLAGELQPLHPVRGAGLRLTLSRRWFGGFKEQTVWEQDFGPWAASRGDATQENYDRLAIPAAAWLVFATEHHPLLRWRHLAVLGTRNWRSYALFAVGAELQEKADPRPARPRYRRALGLSPDNYGARMQLAAAETQVNGPFSEPYEKACESLAELCRTVSDPTDPMYYRIRYNRVIALLPHAKAATQPRESALYVAAGLCTAIMRYRSWNQPPLWPWGRGLRAYLQAVEPAALVLLASVLREMDCAPLTLPRDLPDDLTRAQLWQRLEAARSSLTTSGLDHTAIVGYVLRRHRQLRADARYNLVRYYLRMGAADKAKPELRLVLGQEDPAISRLARDNARWTPALATLLAELAAEAPSPAASNGAVRFATVLMRWISVWLSGWGRVV